MQIETTTTTNGTAPMLAATNSTPYSCERSAFRQGEWVIYTNCGAQRVRKAGRGWQTYALGSSSGRFVAVTGRTLQEILKRLGEKGAN
jgi:hypothetical protein